jgi:hypothetical protein
VTTTIPSRLGSSLPKLHVVSDSSPVTYDPDDVRQCREELWRRIPFVHRRPPAILVERIRDARLLTQINGWGFGSPCLLMCGPTGIGKSTAAALAVIRLMAKGREADCRKWCKVRWYGANELMKSAREWPLGKGECPDLRVASSCDLLVLDDLGNEVEWQSTIFDLLQRRYELGATNIVTSGLNAQQLVARYGEAILRRLVQRNGKMGLVVDCHPLPKGQS